MELQEKMIRLEEDIEFFTNSQTTNMQMLNAQIHTMQTSTEKGLKLSKEESNAAMEQLKQKMIAEQKEARKQDANTMDEKLDDIKSIIESQKT